MSQNSHTPSTHLAGLDGLRGVGCLMVFAVHFGQITGLRGNWGPFDLGRLLENGNTGVALFFGLSGFLLSLPYWNALQSAAPYPPAGRYLVRRAGRILPAYFACLTILLVANRFWLKAGWIRDAALHYTLTFNLFGDTIFRINPPFWTLAVEVQFYLLLPIFFQLVRRAAPGGAIMLMLLFGVAAYVGHFVIMSAATEALADHGGTAAGGKGVSHVLTYSLLAHLPHFLLGVATAGIFASRSRRTRATLDRPSAARELTFWLAALVLFAILGTALDDMLEIPYGRYNLPYVPLLLCVIIFATPITAGGRFLLDSLPMRAIGAISYGVYIYHLPILNAVRRYMGRASFDPREQWLVYGALSLAITLIVASASYWLLERPVLRAVKARRLHARAGT